MFYLGQVSFGYKVVLLRKQNHTKFDAKDIKKLIKTISYKVECMINRRVLREYISN
ncbi:alanine racemase C-terminal domain-containing protein [Clostridium frigidicarnis]|uniref:alanine racemase C-terminal domain-containing protein n=1 Tax=Clostridium frigidicarnis TaxID=84698 RepID=UPI00311A2C03